MSDPVAEKSGFLKMYMSNHPDTLVAYAKWFGKVEESIKSAEMSAIDTKSMTLTCTMQNGSKKDVRVLIEPPLKDYNDVKPRLLEMKALAQEGLGMIKVPKITRFLFPAKARLTSLSTIIPGFLYYFAGSTSFMGIIPNYVASYIGTTVTAWILGSLLAVHALETVYTVYLCQKHSTRPVDTIFFIVATVVCGFPIWQDMRSRIQAARINSVMKIQ